METKCLQNARAVQTNASRRSFRRAGCPEGYLCTTMRGSYGTRELWP
jgi:hypothetical protein